MIARGYHVHPCFQDLTEGIGLNAAAAGKVLPVSHDEINGIIGLNPGHAIVDGVAARFADDVADDKKIHFCSFKPRLATDEHGSTQMGVKTVELSDDKFL